MKQYTEEFGLEQLYMYYKKINRIPSRKDFQENKWKPEFGWYAVHFGSFKNACIDAKILDDIKDEDKKLKYSIDKLIEIADNLQRCPTVKEYDKYKDNAYNRNMFCKITNMTYGEICIKYLSDKYECNKKSYDKKDVIINHIFDLYNNLGRTPLLKETKYDSSTFTRVFKKPYLDFVKDIGLTPTLEPRNLKNDKELLSDFINFVNCNKRLPLVKDFNNKNNNLSSYRFYKQRFKSIKNICDLLNIDYSKYCTMDNVIGTVCLDNKNNVCKSFEEKIISDFLIYNNLYMQKEPSYNELIQGDRRRFDWKIKFNDEIYYVEYFGMYYENKNSKIIKRYREKVNKKINDLNNSNKIEKCIFIYPKDLMDINNFFSNLFKYNFNNNQTNNINIYKHYSKYSDKELFEIIMQYSEDSNFLPYAKTLFKNNKKILYDEIISRHSNYSNFAKLFNVNIPQKANNFWESDTELFNIFEYMINKYNKILNPKEYIKYNDYKLKGYRDAFGGFHDSFINRKLNFLLYFVNKNNYIIESELNWLNNIINNRGAGIKNKITQEQSQKALQIIQILKK